MDDLNGLQWTSNNATNKPPPMSSSIYQAMRATPPISGRSTPLAGPASKPSSKPATPANDSFANLVSFSSAGNSKNLTLQEQQKRLLEERARQQASTGQKMNAPFVGVTDQIWNNLGSGRSTPSSNPTQSSGLGMPKNTFGASTSTQAIKNEEPEEDILAAFNSAAPVDSSTHFPKPGSHAAPPFSNDFSAFDDDDPFGLSEVKAKQKQVSASNTDAVDDDDVLGLLGRPVSEIPKREVAVKHEALVEEKQSPRHPQDKAVAELVDMGFTPEKARQALEATESGLDVQAAVGWLLHQAHEESRQKPRGPPSASAKQNHPSSRDRQPSRRRDEREDGLEWVRDQSRDTSSSRRRDITSSNDKDPTQIATELGSSLFKTAGSLWKQGTKKMQQAVQEFNTGDSDSNTPKWMREASTDGRSRSSSARVTQDRIDRNQRVPKADITNEAMMLEAGRDPPLRQTQRPVDNLRTISQRSSRDHSPALPSRLRSEEVQPAFLSQQPQQPISRQPPSTMKSSLNKQSIEEQASSAYTSSARRRKPASAASLTSNSSAPEPDLLDASAALVSSRPATTTPINLSAKPSRAAASIPSRQASPMIQRSVPKVPPNVLAASKTHRETGTSQFKRGDFSSAHASYTSSLNQIPTTHPITIVILTNRALTALKIGEPKTALSDANNALTAIGPSKGEGESITISENEPPKPMREYYGKALMRKAEALEQVEKWTDAAIVWREAVNGGHGGAISMQGRTRCEKAAGISNPAPAKPSSAASSRPAAVRKAATAPPRPVVDSHASDAAVSKLREANAAAERLDDEKFRLADSVDAKLTAWKGGKADNLRALLGSLDTVLWPEAGWKKVGMAELVLPQKVKIQYMKGIAKVHPDKVFSPASIDIGQD